MDKLIIFNVWWGMASYCEVWWQKIIIDLWSSEEFSPTLDFLIPYANECWRKKQEKKNNKWENVFKWKKYIIDQLIISHPHRDHLSDIENFDKEFYAELVTTPNSNDWMEDESLNRDLVFWDAEKDDKVVYLKDNLINWRTPPLKSCSNQIEIYYIKPKIVENEITPKSDYVNNVSLVCVLNINGKKIMLPWDIMKSWSNWMLDNRVINVIPGTKTETVFKNAVKKINILVAPHHWLESAYNSNLLNEMKDNLELIIIPEEISHEDWKRQVDSGYYGSNYWSWVEICSIDDDSSEKQSTYKTSRWHIIISDKWIYKSQNLEDLIDLFYNI